MIVNCIEIFLTVCMGSGVVAIGYLVPSKPKAKK